jgi:hypothetical protein
VKLKITIAVEDIAEDIMAVGNTGTAIITMIGTTVTTGMIVGNNTNVGFPLPCARRTSAKRRFS